MHITWIAIASSVFDIYFEMSCMLFDFKCTGNSKKWYSVSNMWWAVQRICTVRVCCCILTHMPTFFQLLKCYFSGWLGSSPSIYCTDEYTLNTIQWHLLYRFGQLQNLWLFLFVYLFVFFVIIRSLFWGFGFQLTDESCNLKCHPHNQRWIHKYIFTFCLWIRVDVLTWAKYIKKLVFASAKVILWIVWVNGRMRMDVLWK